MNCEDLLNSDGATGAHDHVLAGEERVRLNTEGPDATGDLVVIEPLLDQDRTIAGFSRVAHDVTRDRRFHQQLLRAERFATLGQIVFGLAHSVGTPLNIICGYAEFLLMRTKPEDPGHKELTVIRDQTRRVASLFNDALDLARPSEGATGSVNVRRLVADSLDQIDHHLRGANVRTSLACATSEPLIYGDARQLKQIVFILLLNTAERVGRGGRLEVAVDDRGTSAGYLTLELLGTEAGGQPHDFSRSLGDFLAEGPDAIPTGVGLTLVRELLRQAGAEVTTRGEDQRGVALVVRFPIRSQGVSVQFGQPE